MKLMLALAWLNFIIQMLYYFRDESRLLYLLKKITTPLLLFTAAAASLRLFDADPRSSLLPAILLTMMGVGEIGIEGSPVVESRTGRRGFVGSRISEGLVLGAGILFLMVNLLLGAALIARSFALWPALAAITVSCGVILLVDILIIRVFRPLPELRRRLFVYSAGLAVLFTGVVLDSGGGFSELGLAAAVLACSDSLVMVRMSAGWDKGSPRGFRILLVFLVVILLLYYLFMLMMTRSAIPA